MSHGGRVIETFFPRKKVGRRACPYFGPTLYELHRRGDGICREKMEEKHYKTAHITKETDWFLSMPNNTILIDCVRWIFFHFLGENLASICISPCFLWHAGTFW